jgi:hypothetical protein
MDSGARTGRIALVYGTEGVWGESWPLRYSPVRRSTAVTTSLSGIVVLIS